MTETHSAALASASGEVDQRARNGRRSANCHRSRTHHGMVQLAHRQGPHQQVDLTGRHRLATGGSVGARRRDERHFRRVLTPGSLVDVVDKPHAHGAIGANGLEAQQRLRIAVDGVLQFGTGVADIGSIDKNGRDTGIDQGRLERTDPRHFQVIDQIAGGEHGTATAVFIGCRVKKLQLHLGRREGDPVQLEVAGFLHFTFSDRDVGDDGLADIRLPDTHGGDTVARNTRRVDQATADGKRTDRSGQVAAVAAPVDEGLVDADLAEQVVDIVLGLDALRQDHGLAGARRGAAHAVDLLAVRVGAADYPQQQRIAGGTWNLRLLGQVLQAEEHAFAGAAADVGGGDFDLGYM